MSVEVRFKDDKMKPQLCKHGGWVGICVICKDERIAQLEAVMEALVEIAERVQEGEDWDLAEFILRKHKEIKNAKG